jgi:pilus assembly protein FimV
MDLPASGAEPSMGAWEPAAPSEPAGAPPKSSFESPKPASVGFDDEPEFRIDLSEPECVVPEVNAPEPLEFDLAPEPAKPAASAQPAPLESPVDMAGSLSADAIEAAATKLELARAYLDMGDVEGARGMLEEVTQEGTSEQRQDARRLLDEIR